MVVRKEKSLIFPICFSHNLIFLVSPVVTTLIISYIHTLGHALSLEFTESQNIRTRNLL